MVLVVQVQGSVSLFSSSSLVELEGHHREKLLSYGT